MANKEVKEAEVVKKATVKKVKADASKTADSVKNLAKDLRDLTLAALNQTLIAAKEDLLNTKKMLRQNELPSSHVIKQMKQKIARIHTVMTEKSYENINEDKETK